MTYKLEEQKRISFNLNNFLPFISKKFQYCNTVALFLDTVICESKYQFHSVIYAFYSNRFPFLNAVFQIRTTQ